MTPHEQKWFATSTKLTPKSSQLGNVMRVHNAINGITKRCLCLVLTSESRVIVGTIQSPILGQRPFPEPNLVFHNAKQIQSAFHSEDSEILVHSTNVRDRSKDISPKIFGKGSTECENQSTYTWSVTDQAKGNFSWSKVILENVYERRPRRKMVKDPVTGAVNLNVKKDKRRVKGKKTTGRNTTTDFLPLDRFQSKWIGRNRLSVPPFLLLMYLH